MFWISLMQQWPIPSFSLPGISKSTKSEEASKKIGLMISGTFEVLAALVLPRVRNDQLRHGHHNVPLSDQPFVFPSGQDLLGRCCRCKKEQFKCFCSCLTDNDKLGQSTWIADRAGQVHHVIFDYRQAMTKRYEMFDLSVFSQISGVVENRS